MNKEAATTSSSRIVRQIDALINAEIALRVVDRSLKDADEIASMERRVGDEQSNLELLISEALIRGEKQC